MKREAEWKKQSHRERMRDGETKTAPVHDILPF